MTTNVAATRLPRRVFGHADEHPYQRLTADRVKLVAAAILVTLSALHVGDVDPAARDAERFFASLPDGAHGLFDAMLDLGVLWVVALVGVVGLLARRWRLALALTLGGLLAWLLGRLLALIVIGAGDPLAGVFDGRELPPYPTVRLAVIAGVVLTASPYLTRPIRRGGSIILGLLAFGTFYVDAGDINAVFAALVLGWGIAAALHLALGSPAGRPMAGQVADALEELGVPVERVRLLPVQPRGSVRMEADTREGETLPVTVYGRDAGDTRLVTKAWHWLLYKDSGPTLTFTRLQQVEHEALCIMSAARAGARVADVVAVGVAGPDAAILVTEATERTGDAAGLPDIWDNLAKMREARIAHGALDAEHVQATSAGPVIVDFSTASVSAPSHRLDQDVAQLLVSSALVVGEAEAVKAATERLGAAAVAAGLPFLQKPALTPSTRQALRADKAMLDRLRDAVVAQTDTTPTEIVKLRRVEPMSAVMIVALLFALWVVLGQIGSISDLIDTLSEADWPWLLVAFVLAQSTNIAYAMATIGSVDQAVPLFPAVLLQLAVSLTNMVAPSGVASTIMNIRFLQKRGVLVGVATASGVIVGLAGTIAQVLLFVLTGIAVGEQLEGADIGGGDSDSQVILVVVFVVAALIGFALLVPKLRRMLREKVWPQIVGALRNVWSILTTPRKLIYIFGGSIAAQILYSLCLLACLTAYGGHVSVGEIIFVNTASAFLASLVPVPGGMGVTEASLIAGLTAFGVPPELATATVVTHRLFTTYLPPIWGSWATKRLVREGYL